MNCRQLANDIEWELRPKSSIHGIFQSRKARDKANLIYLTNLVNFSFLSSKYYLYAIQILIFLPLFQSPFQSVHGFFVYPTFYKQIIIFFIQLRSQTPLEVVQALNFSPWNQISAYILKFREMDYDLNLEEEKGPYSPKSEIKSVDLQNPRAQKAEQNISKSNNASSASKNASDPAQNKQAPTGCTKFCKLDFYEQFFDVSQSQVLERIKLSFIPIKTEFIQSLNEKPDFYGPFWLLTTIIFLVSSTGNLSRYFYNWSKDAYIFKLELVRYAVLVVYCFGFGVPALLYLITKFLGAKLSLPHIICLYGYSFACFIPIFLLCIIPVQVIQWLLISYCMINTSLFLIFNLKDYLAELEPPKKYLTFGIIVGAQIALFLTFKLVFFKMVYEESA